jgi:hypothetical protein
MLGPVLVPHEVVLLATADTALAFLSASEGCSCGRWDRRCTVKFSPLPPRSRHSYLNFLQFIARGRGERVETLVLRDS